MGNDTLSFAERLAQLEARVGKLEGSSKPETPTATNERKKISAKEFLLSKVVQSELQKVLALAYYLENQEGLASFNVGDLDRVFRLAREKLPKNLNDAVNKNISRGLLMEAAERKDSRKAWHLTSTGERFVENEMKTQN